MSIKEVDEELKSEDSIRKSQLPTPMAENGLGS